MEKMDWIKRILDLVTPKHLILVVLIVSGLYVFVPGFLEGIGFSLFAPDLDKYISLAFVVSVALGLINLFGWLAVALVACVKRPFYKAKSVAWGLVGGMGFDWGHVRAIEPVDPARDLFVFLGLNLPYAVIWLWNNTNLREALLAAIAEWRRKDRNGTSERTDRDGNE